jgi:hypothetical protein
VIEVAKKRSSEHLKEDETRTSSMGLFNQAEAYWLSAMALEEAAMSISDIANSRSREIKDQLVSIQREIKGLSKILTFGCFIIVAAIAYFGTH